MMNMKHTNGRTLDSTRTTQKNTQTNCFFFHFFFQLDFIDFPFRFFELKEKFKNAI